MQNLFVPYELSMKLKEKGMIVDNDCIIAEYWQYSTIEPELFDLINNKEEPEGAYWKYRCHAPLWQQVMDWLREEKGIILTVLPIGMYWKYELTNAFENNSFIYNQEGGTVSYYSALQSGIEKALDVIEEQFPPSDETFDGSRIDIQQ